MKLSNLYNNIIGGVGKAAGKLTDYFSGKQTYVRPAEPVPTPVQQQTVNPDRLPYALRQLESSGGADPNTPRNQQRSYTTVPANGNEQPKTVPYDVGYGGEYGLTPVALADLASSKINHEADPSTYTKYGKPVIQGMDPQEIQRELSTPEGAGRLAVKFFMSKRENKEAFTPQSLADDYINLYVGKGGPSDTPENRQRALEFFISLIQ